MFYLSILPLINMWRLLPLLDCCEVLLKTFMDTFLCGHMFHSLGQMPRSRIAGSRGDSVSEQWGFMSFISTHRVLGLYLLNL